MKNDRIPDDLNKWSEQTFEQIINIFKKANGLAHESNQKTQQDLDKFEKDRPDRETVIGGDDMTNLKIALGNADTVDDFLNSI